MSAATDNSAWPLLLEAAWQEQGGQAELLLLL